MDARKRKTIGIKNCRMRVRFLVNETEVALDLTTATKSQSCPAGLTN